MSVYRRVSATDTSEATEVQVSGAVENPDGTITITTGDITSWPSECDFITYARDEDGKVDESTRVVWYGNKDDSTNVTARRVGGSETYLPDSLNAATVVPTHLWANHMVGGLMECLPQDGKKGINAVSGNPLVFSVGKTKPAAIAGRTVVWLKPLV